MSSVAIPEEGVPESGPVASLAEDRWLHVFAGIADTTTEEEAVALVLEQGCEYLGFLAARSYVQTESGSHWMTAGPWADALMRHGPSCPQAPLTSTSTRVYELAADSLAGYAELGRRTHLGAVVRVPVAGQGRSAAVLEFFAADVRSIHPRRLEALNRLRRFWPVLVPRPYQRPDRIVESLFREVPSLVAVVDRSLHCHFANRAWTAVFGQHQTGSSAWTALIHDRDVTSFLDGASRVTRTGQSWSLEMRIRRAEGGYRHLELDVSVAGFSEAGDAQLLLIARDISDRKAIEERFDIALDSAGIGIWTLSFADGEVTWDESTYRILGYRLDFRPSLDWWQSSVLPDDVSRTFENFGAHIRGETSEYHIRHRLKNGRGVWQPVLGAGRVVDRDEDGAPRTMTGIIMDLSEVESARAQAEASERRLSLALKAANLGLWDWHV
ncbi:MAG: PAS domain-containing protein, partial [Myxococcota bacterium]